MINTELPSRPIARPTQAFDLAPRNASRGVAILFHGLTGTPDEMLPLTDLLRSEGYRCIGPMLKGHNESVEALRRVRLETWYAQVHQLLGQYATKNTDRVLLCGLSFGALLALWIAAQGKYRVDDLMLLSPPIRLRSPRVEALHKLLRFCPDCILECFGYRIKAARKPNYLTQVHNAYDRYPIATAERTLRLRDTLINNIPVWDRPLMLALDPEDHLIDAPQVSAWFRSHFPHVEVHELRGGQHELPLGHAFPELCAAIRAYLAARHSK